MKKFFAFVIAILLVLSFAACSGAPDSTEGTTTNPSDTPKPDIKSLTPAEVEAAIAKAIGDGYLCTVDIVSACGTACLFCGSPAGKKCGSVCFQPFILRMGRADICSLDDLLYHTRLHLRQAG